MPSTYSPAIGELFAALLAKHGLSLRQASIRTNGAVSPAWWGELKSGRVPSREVLDGIAEAFPDDDLSPAYALAGQIPPNMSPEVWAEILTVAREASEAHGLPLDEVLRDMARQYAPR